MFQKNFRHFGSGPSTVCISFDLWKQNILQFFMVYSSQLIQARELLEKLILACARLRRHQDLRHFVINKGHKLDGCYEGNNAFGLLHH